MEKDDEEDEDNAKVDEPLAEVFHSKLADLLLQDYLFTFLLQAFLVFSLLFLVNNVLHQFALLLLIIKFFLQQAIWVHHVHLIGVIAQNHVDLGLMCDGHCINHGE